MLSLVALVSQFRGSQLETLLATTCLFLLPALLVAARREFATLIRYRTKRELGALLLVLALALGLRVHPLADPFHQRVFFDEWEYMVNARSILLDGSASICVKGSLENCQVQAVSANNKIGYTVLQAFAFSLGGVSDATAMYVTLSLSVASVALAWMLAASLFPGGRWAPIAAAVFMAVLPLHVRYSTCAATDSVSLFFGGLVMLAALADARAPSRRTMYLVAVALVLAVTVRYENVLLIVPLALVLRWRKAARGPASIALVLIALFVTGYTSSIDMDDGSPFATSLSIIGRSVRSSVPFWLGWDHHPLILTALMLVALWRADGDRSHRFLLAWLMVFVVLYSIHDWPMDIWDQDRHLLQGYLPIILLAAAGVDAMRELMGKGSDHLVGLVLLVAVASSISLLVSCPGQGCTDHIVRELEFARAYRDVRPECIIAAPTPVFINWAWGRQAVYFERMEDIDDILARGECVLLHENLYCDPSELGLAIVYSRIPRVCATYNERYSIRTLAEDTAKPYPIRLSVLGPRRAMAAGRE